MHGWFHNHHTVHADMQTYKTILGFGTAVIVAMNCKTSRMTTAAGQLMELKSGDCIIIKIQ